jgi:hypothetical protein
MARARMQQQQIYPGVYQGGRGARPAGQVSSNDLSTQAQQLQMLQRYAQLTRTAEAVKNAQHQQQQVQVQQQQQQQQQQHQQQQQFQQVRAKPNVLRKPTPTPAGPPETITLEESEDDINEVEANGEEIVMDEDDGEFVLDGAPEYEVCLI